MMPCPWNLDLTDEPDPATHTITCLCKECGRYADLDCERDFRTGALVVSVRTCTEKGGLVETRERADG